MMDKAPLGKDGPEIARLGYGAMGLEGYYGESDDQAAIRTLNRAIDLGMMIDTADAYGNGHNETLIAKALKARSRKAFIATKFSIVFDANQTGSEVRTGWGFALNVNGRPAYARHALDASLERLGVDAIDLWYAHFPDPQTPIEETIGAMSHAVQQGKVRISALAMPPQTKFVGRTRSIASRRSNTNIRSGGARSKPTCCRHSSRKATLP